MDRRAPELEEDVALGNIGLDLIGHARSLLHYAGTATGRSEDDLAYWRDEPEWRNAWLFEQPNGDFAHTIARQLVASAYLFELYGALTASTDPTLAAIAAKAVKEVDYHRDHATQWVLRLAGGTDESRRRMIVAITDTWPYVDELFVDDALVERLADDGVAVLPSTLRPGVRRRDRRRPRRGRARAADRPHRVHRLGRRPRRRATPSTSVRSSPRCRCSPARTRGRRGEPGRRRGRGAPGIRRPARARRPGRASRVGRRGDRDRPRDPGAHDRGPRRAARGRARDDGIVRVQLTPTYSGCPALDAMRDDVLLALTHAGYDEVRVELVLAPAWTTDWMSDAGKEKLRRYGIQAPSGHAAARRPGLFACSSR